MLGSVAAVIAMSSARDTLMHSILNSFGLDVASCSAQIWLRVALLLLQSIIVYS